jgi:hypothetical protein
MGSPSECHERKKLFEGILLGLKTPDEIQDPSESFFKRISSPDKNIEFSSTIAREQDVLPSFLSEDG